MALSKVVNDFLIIEIRITIQSFILMTSKRFEAGRHHIDYSLVFDGIRIQRDSTSGVKYDMEEYFIIIRSLAMTRERREEESCESSDAELKEYLHLMGYSNLINHDFLRQGAFASSHVQKFVGNLKVLHHINANKVL